MAIKPHPTHAGWYVYDHYIGHKRTRDVFESYDAAIAFRDATTQTAPQIVHPKLETIVDEYLEWVKKNQSSETYTGKYYRLTRYIIPRLGQYRVKELNQNTLDRYGKDMSKPMLRHDLMHLKALLSWMKKRNYADKLHFDIEIPSYKSKIKLIPSPQDILEVINAVPYDEVRVLCLMILYAGLRPLEAKLLKWDNYRNDCIILAHTKTNEPRIIPIPDPLQEWFTRNEKASGWIFESRKKRGFPYRNLYGILKTAGDSVDVHVSPHMLRHASAHALYNISGDIREVQLHLRHTKVTTTEIYLGMSAQRQKASTAKITNMFGQLSIRTDSNHDIA